MGFALKLAFKAKMYFTADFSRLAILAVRLLIRDNPRNE